MKKFVDSLQKAQVIAGTVFLLIFLLSVTFQVFSRYLEIPATWTQDVSMYSFIWAVFMGASAMVYEKKHFAFTSLSDYIKSEKFKICLGILISILMLVFSVLMLYYGTIITKQFWNYRWVNIPALPRGITWICLPISGLTSSIYLITIITEDIKTLLKGGKE